MSWGRMPGSNFLEPVLLFVIAGFVAVDGLSHVLYYIATMISCRQTHNLILFPAFATSACEIFFICSKYLSEFFYIRALS